MPTRTIEVVQKVPASGPLPPGEVSIKDAAAALGVSSETVRRWIAAGRVKARKIRTGSRGREGWRYTLTSEEFARLRDGLRSGAI